MSFVQKFPWPGLTQRSLNFERAVRIVVPPSISLPNPRTDQDYLVMQNMKTLGAFAAIVNVLELPCNHGRGFNISPYLQTPPSLKPTARQQIIPHGQYVDMLPWPTMRDNILAMIDTIDEASLCNEMATDELKVWGAVPWEPMSWELSKGFVEKWWFILDDDILHVTNFWRMQRGEARLVLPKLTILDDL
jgi:hypothetical protein